MFIPRKSKAGSCAVILDVGSESVGAAIVDFSTAKPEMVYAHRENIVHAKSVDAEARLRSVREALLASTLELSSAGIRALSLHNKHTMINRVFVVAGVPWSKTAVRFTRVKDDEPFRATAEYAKKILAESEKKTDLGSKEAELLKEFGLKIVNDQIIGQKLNGYTVEAFTGQEATELEIAHLVELAPQAVIDAVKDAEKHFAPHIEIEARAFGAVLFGVARDLFPYTKDFLAFDIAGEASECVISQNGTLVDATSSEYGLHTYLRDIADKLKTLPEEARGHLRDYIASKAHKDATEAIVSVEDIFVGKINAMLEELRSKYVLPRTIFLATDPGLAPYMGTLLSHAYASHGEKEKVQIVPFEAKTFAEKIVWCHTCEEDVYLGLEACFFHTILREKSIRRDA